MNGAAEARWPRLRWGAVALLAGGVALAVAVLGGFGPAQVWASLAGIGWRGLATLSLASLIPLGLLGAAWWALDGGAADRLRAFVWARAIRDAATELLPFSQFGGLAIGARAAVLSDVPPARAFAGTVVDVTAEMIAQLGFTGLGLAILVMRDANLAAGGGAAIDASLIGLAISAIAAVAFVLAQRHGGGPALALARRFLPPAEAATAAFVRELDSLYRRPARLGAGVGLHLAAWIASALSVWLALAAGGAHVPLAAILALEALVGAVRSAAFFAPMAIGVQEGAYALIGPMLGLPPDLALAISLLRRGRDLVVGLPVLIAWQGREGRRLIASRRR